MLRIKPWMLPSVALEAMKKAAQTGKRIQPRRWNFLSRFPSSVDTVCVFNKFVAQKVVEMT